MKDWRQKLWQKVKKKIDKESMALLEAGVGTGKNIEYYPNGIEIYGIDFSP